MSGCNCSVAKVAYMHNYRARQKDFWKTRGKEKYILLIEKAIWVPKCSLISSPACYFATVKAWNYNKFSRENRSMLLPTYTLNAPLTTPCSYLLRFSYIFYPIFTLLAHMLRVACSALSFPLLPPLYIAMFLLHTWEFGSSRSSTSSIVVTHTNRQAREGRHAARRKV